MNDLCKYVLLNNLKHSLKYKMKNNNDTIDILLESLYYCLNNSNEKYYSEQIYKINKYKDDNYDIKIILNKIKEYHSLKHFMQNKTKIMKKQAYTGHIPR